MTNHIDEAIENMRESQICYIIGEWYLLWKFNLINGEESYIKAAVFLLKNLIKYSKNKYGTDLRLSENDIEKVNETIDEWVLISNAEKDVINFQKNFGRLKETLKIMICQKLKNS